MYRSRVSRSTGIVVVTSMLGAFVLSMGSFFADLPDIMQRSVLYIGEVISHVGGLPTSGGVSRPSSPAAYQFLGVLIITWPILFGIGMLVRRQLSKRRLRC